MKETGTFHAVVMRGKNDTKDSMVNNPETLAPAIFGSREKAEYLAEDLRKWAFADSGIVVRVVDVVVTLEWEEAK